ncbi:branched-chain amino acid ABC transporter permease [Patescibacteria group bacterium]|nr:MAG: branched-chain amino acid ABC transporter permease [Patescibacteria group bacterium]
MDLFLELLSNILIPGGIFVLITVGFSVIYSVTRILHVAHGGVVLAAGYAFYAGTVWFHWPVLAAVPWALASAVLLGWLLNAAIYERLRDRAAVSTAGALIATLSALLILQNMALAIFGSGTKSLADFQGAAREFGPVVLTGNELRILVIAPIVIFLLAFFLGRTKTGKALRAVADNEIVAEVVGIPAKKMRAVVFAVGSLLAGVAGILFAIEYNLEPGMSTGVAVRMFFRAILGGVGSVGGAVAGSLAMETATAFTGWFWNVGWTDFVGFLLMFVVLLFRPQGLWGKKKRLV